MSSATSILAALPVAVYTTDAEGRITFYNEAAAELWGHRPQLGTDQWCGSWRLYWADGRPLPHDECPMAIMLKEGRAMPGAEAIAERPDGTRVPFAPYPSLLRDEQGRVSGAVNVLVNITDRKLAEVQAARLAAIVSSSEDAIISKTLGGIITSWNAGASRIFGYAASEIIGQPILRLIPPDLQQEETMIIAKLKRGERIEHYDTIRLTKDGRLIDVSLSVSPIRDGSGRVVGASKVARDITERKHNEELQRLLVEELNHRVKNTLATVQSIAAQSLRRARDPQHFVDSFSGRVQALARAHDLLVKRKMHASDMSDVVREQVLVGIPDDGRISFGGPATLLPARSAMQLSLVLHELATNARKYGALAGRRGRLSISWRLESAGLALDWRESEVEGVSEPSTTGFGTSLITRALAATGGDASIRYESGGVVCSIRLPFEDTAVPLPKRRNLESGAGTRHSAKKILVVEDEALIAMDLEDRLTSIGYSVIGPAGTVAEALSLISSQSPDAALLDANLAGEPVDVIAAALSQRGIPFAFATGHGPKGLPAAFSQTPVLAKPFNSAQMIAILETLLEPREREPRNADAQATHAFP